MTTCVLAGDIADGRFPTSTRACSGRCVQFYAHIIMVTGNHDYYKSDLARSHRTIEVAISGLQAQGIDNRPPPTSQQRRHRRRPLPRPHDVVQRPPRQRAATSTT
jgi:hypothetical protein